jgi:ParB-like nuclease domain.
MVYCSKNYKDGKKMETVYTTSIAPLHDADDVEKLNALTEDMEENGWVGSPIVVYQSGDGFQAMNGSHRLAAALTAGLDEIPVEIISCEMITGEQYEILEAYHDADGFVTALEDLIGDGVAGLDAALDIMRAEIEKERE